MAQPLPQKNLQEGMEPITITLRISSPTIEPQLIISLVKVMSIHFKQTQPSSNTAKKFQSSKFLFYIVKNFLIILQASMAQW